MFWTLYELLINIFQGFLFTWFITKLLVKKCDSPLPYIVCSLLTAAALSSFLLFDSFTWDTWIFVFIIVYSLVFFKDSVWQKLFWDFVLIIVAGSIVGIHYQFFSLLTGADTDRILSSGLPRLLFTFSSNLLLYLSFFLITRLFPEQTSNIRPSFLLLAINILCIFLIDVFFRMHLAYDLPLRWLFIGCFISFAIGITTVVTNRLIIRYEQEKQTYLFQEQMLKETKSRSEDLQQVYDSMLKLRHDMRSYVNDIQKMVETGDLAKEPVYLDELEEQVLPFYSSGNSTLDSVYRQYGLPCILASFIKLCLSQGYQCFLGLDIRFCLTQLDLKLSIIQQCQKISFLHIHSRICKQGFNIGSRCRIDICLGLIDNRPEG